MKLQRGRPTIYTEEKQAECLDSLLPHIADGGTLAAWCRQDGTPSPSEVGRWLDANPAFKVEYTRARILGADALASQCLELASLPAKTMVEVQQRRLQIETILRLLAKWFPKAYGDKVEITGDLNLTVSPLAQLRELEQTRGRVLDSQRVKNALGLALGHMEETFSTQPIEVEQVADGADSIF